MTALRSYIQSWLRVALFFLLLLTPVFIITRGYIPVFQSPTVEAAASTTLNFQARLYTSSGNTVPDGNYSIAFNLYEDSTGGASLWTETQASVPVKHGYFSVQLGSSTAFPGSLDWGDDKFLTMNVNADGEMNPRIKLTAVPYAFRAAEATTLKETQGSYTGDLSFGSLTGTHSITLPDLTGTVALLENNQTFTGALTFSCSRYCSDCHQQRHHQWQPPSQWRFTH